jgi:site-specific recombinase XerD
MSEIVVAPGGVLAQRTPAEDRADLDAACHSEDPWVRGDGWARRWLLDHTDGTADQYARVWRSLTTFGAMIDVAPLEWTRSDVMAWVHALRTIGDPAVLDPQPLANSSIRQRMSAASSLFQYCLDEYCDLRSCGCGGAPWVNRNPVPKGKHRPKPPPPGSRQQFLSVEQIRALMREADLAGPREAALVALLLGNLRVTAACQSRIENVGPSGGHNAITAVDKGDATRQLALPPWLYRRVEAVIGDRTEGYILCTRTGRPLHRRHAHKIVKRLAERAGIKGRVGPHTLRHSIITQAFMDGEPLEVIQDWSSHADPKTTRGYDRARGALDRSPAYRVTAHYFNDELADPPPDAEDDS